MAQKLKKGNLVAVLVAALLIGGVFYGHHLVSTGSIGGKASDTAVPKAVKLVNVADDNTGSAEAAPLPGTGAGCSGAVEVRKEVMAWNAQMGEMFATGGKQATKGSLMCKHDVNYKLTRQDDTGKMQADLIAFAKELHDGTKQPKSGTHFVSIMGDGGAQFMAGVNAELAKLGPEYTAEVIGSAGYSRGEDKLMGPPAWKKNPKLAAGGTISGFLRDGDWNIAMLWANQNDICNNPDEKTYDPSCINWIAADDFLKAAELYITGYCEDRPEVLKGIRTGRTHHVCADAVVTWTPGDVNIAEKKGGLVSILSTKENSSQMPNVIIGIKAWDAANRNTVKGMLQAIFEGGDQVRQFPDALSKAGEISADVYGEKDGDYWVKYYRGITQQDKTGLSVELGGSKVNNLADNIVLFGLEKGRESAFAATYTEFGNVVVQQYPALVPTFPAVNKIVNTSFLQDIAGSNLSVATAELPSFDKSKAGRAVGHKRWHFEFDTGRATFKNDPKTKAELTELKNTLEVQDGLLIQIDGYTDHQGTAEANLGLSEKRAFAVKQFLQDASPAAFPDTRFINVTGHGWDNPVASNTTPDGKAQNRRVEVTTREQQ